MGRGYRQNRIGEEIRKIISGMLVHGLKDPRLNSMISITAVEVTSDNSYATVYFSPLGVTGSEAERAEEQEKVLEAFDNAKGYIRRQIGHDMKLRHTPELIFKVDHSLDHARHIEDIISKL